MKDLTKTNNPYGDEKVFDACSIFGMMNLKGERFSAKDPVRAIANMHDRGNGLGGGFAAYGIYPEYKDDYAFQIMYLDREAKKEDRPSAQRKLQHPQRRGDANTGSQR